MYYFEQGQRDIPIGDHREIILKYVYEKRRYVEITKQVALMTANINPEKAVSAYQDYLEAISPEYKQQQANKLSEMQDMLDKEAGSVYRVYSKKIDEDPFMGTKRLM